MGVQTQLIPPYEYASGFRWKIEKEQMFSKTKRDNIEQQ